MKNINDEDWNEYLTEIQEWQNDKYYIGEKDRVILNACMIMFFKYGFASDLSIIIVNKIIEKAKTEMNNNELNYKLFQE